MITREQFKEIIAAIEAAEEKEAKFNEALKMIWDADQGQHTPFYIWPLWRAVRKMFNALFGLEEDPIIGSELDWWLEHRKTGKAIIYYKDGTAHNVSAPDDYYDYLTQTK